MGSPGGESRGSWGTSVDAGGIIQVRDDEGEAWTWVEPTKHLMSCLGERSRNWCLVARFGPTWCH